MKYLILLFTFVLSFAPVLAQELPRENPREVKVKGRIVSHSWRGGRIYVPASEIDPLLNTQSESPSVDLVRALEEKGGYLYQVVDGRFEARRDPSRYNTSAVDPRAARAHNQREIQKDRVKLAKQVEEEANRPRLNYEVLRFVADTGYVRAYVRVVNQGGGASESVNVVADFTDGYGKAFARDVRPIGPLQPGDAIDLEMFSMVEDDVTLVNGVIRTINNEKVRVTFQEIR